MILHLYAESYSESILPYSIQEMNGKIESITAGRRFAIFSFAQAEPRSPSGLQFEKNRQSCLQQLYSLSATKSVVT